MIFDLTGVPTIFGNDESASFRIYKLFIKVIMLTLEIPLSAVEPSAGGVDQSVRIQFPQ